MEQSAIKLHLLPSGGGYGRRYYTVMAVRRGTAAGRRHRLSLTALLYGGAPVENGRAVYSNFHQNRLLRMNECPPIDVYLVSSPDERPLGLGEMSAPLGVPAVLNAIYAATGTRIRKIPLPAQIQV